MTASYQPQRRARPVVTPNSPPTERSRSPYSSSSSVGNGPEPTRVVYAFTIPTARLSRLGPMPEPVDAPPAVGLLEVTNGIAAVVDVEQRALAALEQHDLAFVERLGEQQAGVGDVRREDLGVAAVLVAHLVDVDGAPVVDLGQHLVLLAQRELDLGAEDSGVEQVLRADADAGHLVAVRRADAAAGGADPRLAEIALGDFVQRPVVRHDQVRVGADLQLGDVDAALAQAVHLLDAARPGRRPPRCR